MKKKNEYDLLDLSDKPFDQEFTDDEISFLKEKLPKSKYRVVYAIYKAYSHKGKYFAIMIDQHPFATRRSGVENIWNFLEKRELSQAEYDFMIDNFGCFNRRFYACQFATLEELIQEDKNRGIITPDSVIRAMESFQKPEKIRI